MGVVFRTADIPAGDLVARWRDTVCATFGSVDVRVESDGPFRGEVRVGSLGAVRFATVSGSHDTRHVFRRTPRLIRRESPEIYKFSVCLRGNSVLEQGRTTVALGTGDVMFSDFNRPFEWRTGSAAQPVFQFADFLIPQRLLPFTEGEIASVGAASLGASGPCGALATSLVSRLAADAALYPPATATRLSAILLDLVTALLAEELRRPEMIPPESARRVLLMRIHSFIEHHLTDPELGPPAVAAAHHISLRSLHQLFADQDTTVGAWIRERRLQRVRRDLADPALRGLPVSAIAARYGFDSPAGFNRTFKHVHGIPPGQFRLLSLARSKDS